MKSHITINADGSAKSIVSLNDQGENYFLLHAANKANVRSTWYTEALNMLNNGKAVSVSIDRGHAYNIWNIIQVCLTADAYSNPRTAKACSGGDFSSMIGGIANDTLNNLYSHSVDMPKSLGTWRKRKAKVPAMFYDGSREAYEKAVMFTDLSPIFGAYGYDGENFTVPTFEGSQTVHPNSYLVRGPEGEFYPISEGTMLGLRHVVPGEVPFKDMPHVQNWENIQTTVLAAPIDESTKDVVTSWISDMLTDPYEVTFPRTGVIKLTTGTRNFVGHYGDVLVVSKSDGKTKARFVRDDIFRNTYETTPDMISKGVEEE